MLDYEPLLKYLPKELKREINQLHFNIGVIKTAELQQALSKEFIYSDIKLMEENLLQESLLEEAQVDIIWIEDEVLKAVVEERKPWEMIKKWSKYAKHYLILQVPFMEAFKPEYIPITIENYTLNYWDQLESWLLIYRSQECVKPMYTIGDLLNNQKIGSSITALEQLEKDYKALTLENETNKVVLKQTQQAYKEMKEKKVQLEEEVDQLRNSLRQLEINDERTCISLREELEETKESIKKNLEGTLQQVSLERDALNNQLYQIHTSGLWKVGLKYYWFRDHFPGVSHLYKFLKRRRDVKRRAVGDEY